MIVIAARKSEELPNHIEVLSLAGVSFHRGDLQHWFALPSSGNAASKQTFESGQQSQQILDK